MATKIHYSFKTKSSFGFRAKLITTFDPFAGNKAKPSRQNTFTMIRSTFYALVLLVHLQITPNSFKLVYAFTRTNATATILSRRLVIFDLLVVCTILQTLTSI